jgi:hypothetical protein
MVTTGAAPVPAFGVTWPASSAGPVFHWAAPLFYRIPIFVPGATVQKFQASPRMEDWTRGDWRLYACGISSPNFPGSWCVHMVRNFYGLNTWMPCRGAIDEPIAVGHGSVQGRWTRRCGSPSRPRWNTALWARRAVTECARSSRPGLSDWTVLCEHFPKRPSPFDGKIKNTTRGPHD